MYNQTLCDTCVNQDLCAFSSEKRSWECEEFSINSDPKIKVLNFEYEQFHLCADCGNRETCILQQQSMKFQCELYN